MSDETKPLQFDADGARWLGRMLAFTARTAWTSSLFLNGDRSAYAFMKAVSPGCWVMESSTVGQMRRAMRGGDEWTGAIGRLIVKREEYYPFQPGEDDEPGADLGGFTDTTWHIESIDGRHVSWRNCDFFRIPTDFFEAGSRMFPDADDSDESWAAEAMLRHGIPADPDHRKNATPKEAKP